MDQNNGSSRITFEGEEFQRPVQSFKTKKPKLVGWVIRYSGGYIKDERQANYVLLGFAVLAITISLFLIFGGVLSTNRKTLSDTQIEQIIRNQNGVRTP